MRGYELPVIAPTFICSASSNVTFNPRAMSFVISVEPIEKTSIETGILFSNTAIETVSEPIFARTQPAIFWDLVKVTKLAAIGEAMTS